MLRVIGSIVEVLAKDCLRSEIEDWQKTARSICRFFLFYPS